VSITIRPFTPGDQEPARNLVLEGLAQHFGQLDRSLNSDLEDIKSSYIDQGHLFLVAVIDGRVVGTGGLIFSDQMRGQLVRVSVIKDLRRNGIGRAIVNHLVSACRQRNLLAIEAETSLSWVEAARLYRSCGFVDLSRDQESIYFQLVLEEK